MSTADLNNLNADVNVAPPSQYVDNAGPGLLPEGWYTVELKGYEVVTDPETGEFKNAINMTELKVVSPDEFAGRSVRNLRIFTTTFDRHGVRVSMLGDFIRGIDDTAEWTGLAGACEVLQKAIDRNTPIRIKFQWEAFDWEGYRDNGGLNLTKKSPEEKELRKQATIKKMANFPQNPDGTYRASVTGPLSGETLDARLSVGSIVTSSRR